MIVRPQRSCRDRIILHLITAALSLSGYARVTAQTSVPVARTLQHEVLQTWTVEQGLPHNFITAIQQTPDGFVWVGTYGGLARFDGLRFRSFDEEAPPALRGKISDLTIDARGALWIATDNGLLRYADSTFAEVPLRACTARAVGQLLPTRDGQGVWAQCGNGIFKVDAATRTVTLPVRVSGHLLSYTEGKPGELWCAEGDGVSVYEAGKRVRTTALPGVNILYTSPQQDIYAADGHHVFRWSAGRFLPQQIANGDGLVRLLIDRSGAMWTASGGLRGVSRIAAGSAETLDDRHGLLSNDARVLYGDREGDMWVGTIAGLQRLHRGVFTAYGPEDGLAPGRAQYDAVFEDGRGAIWAGTLRSGVARFDGGRWQRFDSRHGLKRGQVRGFAQGAEQPVVAISDYGMYAGRGGTFHKLPNIPGGYVTSPMRDADGDLWFSQPHAGVYRWHAGQLTHYGQGEGLTSDSVWALAPGRGAHLWAGTQAGLYEWDGTVWTRTLATQGTVLSVSPAARGGLFLGTTHGLLYRPVTGEPVTLRQENGLPSDIIFSLVEDAQANLWMATARGICRMPRAAVDAWVGKAPAQLSPVCFTRDDGVKSGVLPLSQVSALYARNHLVWFATDTGPVSAAEGELPELQPTAVLDEVTVDDQAVANRSGTIAPGRHRCVFTFTAPAFVAPQQVRFRYRLNGWDTQWVQAGASRQAVYTGLPPGKYSFEVQAVGRTGEGGPVSRALALQVQPFFWQTTPFRIAVLVVLGGTLAETVRRRTLRHAERLNMRFQERSAERERIASQIHDTFVQDLTGTALKLELVELQVAGEPIEAQRSLQQISAGLRAMIARSRDIVFNLHLMAGFGDSLLDLLRSVEQEFRLGALPGYEVRSAGPLPVLPPFLRDEIYRICREAVANAFRHARARQVVVTVTCVRGWLTVQVIDDGVGMSSTLFAEGRPGHFGLTGMQAQAERIRATLQIESSPSPGTRLCLRVPLSQEGMLRRSWRKLSARSRSDATLP